jgi:hypothetical protein
MYSSPGDLGKLASSAALEMAQLGWTTFLTSTTATLDIHKHSSHPAPHIGILGMHSFHWGPSAPSHATVDHASTQ